MSDSAFAVHDVLAREIRFTCECGSVVRVRYPDPFELLSLYQGQMWAMCGECKKMNLLELCDVLDE